MPAQALLSLLSTLAPSRLLCRRRQLAANKQGLESEGLSVLLEKSYATWQLWAICVAGQHRLHGINSFAQGRTRPRGATALPGCDAAQVRKWQADIRREQRGIERQILGAKSGREI